MIDPAPKKILFLCIAISLGVHTLFLVFLQSYSLWFYSRVELQGPTTSWSHLLPTVSRDQILKEAFSSVPGSAIASYQPKQELSILELANLPIPIQHSLSISSPAQTPPTDELLSHTTRPYPISSFSLPAIQDFDCFATLSKDLFSLISSPLSTAPPQFLYVEQIIPSKFTEPPVPTPPCLASESPSSFASSPLPLPLAQQESSPPKSNFSILLPRLPQLPSLSDLSTINLSEAFETELTFLPKSDGSGYIFALTLIPKVDLHLPKIRQRITFLIDRANSIQRERLIATKHAVLRALEELDPEDSFNIIAFDHKMDKLFPTFMAPTQQAISKAETFLNQIHLGSFFSTSELYKPLLLTIPSYVEEDELYSAILLTDGETLSKKQNEQTLLDQWTLQNQGKVSLYAIGMERDIGSEILETICTLNRGTLIQSTTHRGLKRHLLRLARTIYSPIAKNLSSKAISRSPQNRIEIYPQSPISPHLYLHQPYLIVGSTETLDDFVIFVQGKFKDKWLNIKKTVSFINAKKGGTPLKLAYNLFEKCAANSEQQDFISKNLSQ